MKKKPWFESWFDSPYYHILYHNRNDQEAKGFIDNLLHYLTPQLHEKNIADADIKILDLACGKGRHSVYMADKGFDVTGIDLSENSIAYARQFERENLSFFQHDMRKVFRINYFDYIFNFFTSFGYFKNDADNLLALRQIALGLKPDGVLILDYFNSKWVIDNLKSGYIEKANNIDFHIKKYIENGYVYKKIAFSTEGGEKYNFQERVRLFTFQDFKDMFDKSGLKIINIFGDFQLNPFDENTSKRLIIKAVKNK
jgi:SAM-dependent methyltransferase